MADRAESNKVPTRNEPNSDQEPQRSRGLDDHPTPPHRDEMNRKTAPGGDSAAPSCRAPVANRITATESPTKKACNGLLQHGVIPGSSHTQALGISSPGLDGAYLMGPSKRWRATMERYVGLDVSLKQTSICVVSQTGSVMREGVVDSDPEVIAAFVRSKAPGAVRIGLETGPTATWLWTELKRLGLPVICIDARHARAVLKMQINKSDRNDAAGIARIMQTGWFKEVRVKDLDSHTLKALLVSR